MTTDTMRVRILGGDTRGLSGLLELYEEVVYLGHERALVAWAMDELKACIATCEDMMDDQDVTLASYGQFSDARIRAEIAFSRKSSGNVCGVFHVWSRMKLHDNPREVFARKLISFLDPVTALGWLTKVNLYAP
jgi:hypothetical protein